MLKERLRQALIDQAQTGNPTTYRDLANRLGLEPPNTIHRITEALESLMEDDVTAGRPNSVCNLHKQDADRHPCARVLLSG